MAVLILLYVVAERLLELAIAARNTRRLLAQGAVEAGGAHYPVMVAMHASWLVAIIAWVVWTSPGVHTATLVFYVLLQPLRFWVMATLGKFWTTRIITLPGAPMVARGPYRFVRHPNYVVVVLEIAALPLVFGAWHIAVVFSLLNAAMLRVRIRSEETATAARR